MMASNHYMANCFFPNIHVQPESFDEYRIVQKKHSWYFNVVKFKLSHVHNYQCTSVCFIKLQIRPRNHFISINCIKSWIGMLHYHADKMISRSDLKFDKTDTCTLIITDMTKFEFDDVEISTVFFFGLFDIHQSYHEWHFGDRWRW